MLLATLHGIRVLQQSCIPRSRRQSNTRQRVALCRGSVLTKQVDSPKIGNPDQSSVRRLPQTSKCHKCSNQHISSKQQSHQVHGSSRRSQSHADCSHNPTWIPHHHHRHSSPMRRSQLWLLSAAAAPSHTPSRHSHNNPTPPTHSGWDTSVLHGTIGAANAVVGAVGVHAPAARRLLQCCRQVTSEGQRRLALLVGCLHNAHIVHTATAGTTGLVNRLGSTCRASKAA